MLKEYVFVAKVLNSNCFTDGSHELSTWNEFVKVHCLKEALDNSSLFWNKWYFLYNYSSYLVCSVLKTRRSWEKKSFSYEVKSDRFVLILKFRQTLTNPKWLIQLTNCP